MYLQSLTPRNFLSIHISSKYYRLFSLPLSPSVPCYISSRLLLNTVMMIVIRFIQYISHLSAPDSALVFLFETRARPEHNSDLDVVGVLVFYGPSTLFRLFRARSPKVVLKVLISLHKAIYFSWLGPVLFVCCLAHWGSTVGFRLLQCSSDVVRYPRDLQVSVAARYFCRVLIFVSS